MHFHQAVNSKVMMVIVCFKVEEDTIIEISFISMSQVAVFNNLAPPSGVLLLLALVLHILLKYDSYCSESFSVLTTVHPAVHFESVSLLYVLVKR